MEKMENKRGNFIRKTAAALFLLAIWQLLAIWIGRTVFLPSPAASLSALVRLAQTKSFYMSIGNSFLRIAAGFGLAVAAGSLFAIFAVCSPLLLAVLDLLMLLVKSIPVASFVILVLLWVESKSLSIVISFLMVLPVIYTNIRDGIRRTDPKLLEMAKVFNLSLYRRIRYIYLPAVMPYFVSACSIGLGFCWKSGIAAEVIGLPKNSIGENLYEAKLYLMTPELFAWTAVIAIVSMVFEKLVMVLVKTVQKRAG